MIEIVIDKSKATSCEIQAFESLRGHDKFIAAIASHGRNNGISLTVKAFGIAKNVVLAHQEMVRFENVLINKVTSVERMLHVGSDNVSLSQLKGLKLELLNLQIELAQSPIYAAHV